MPDPANGQLDQVVRDAMATGAIQSAAIFVVTPGSTTLQLAAAAGIEGQALEGLSAAVRNPEHPVARAIADDGPSFDVFPINPGGPRLRSHLPLATTRERRRVVVGVLAVTHDAPLGDDERQRLNDLADAAAGVAQP